MDVLTQRKRYLTNKSFTAFLVMRISDVPESEWLDSDDLD
jgi:hypothetical protein